MGKPVVFSHLVRQKTVVRVYRRHVKNLATDKHVSMRSTSNPWAFTTLFVLDKRNDVFLQLDHKDTVSWILQRIYQTRVRLVNWIAQHGLQLLCNEGFLRLRRDDDDRR